MAPRARGARTRLAGCAPPGRDAGVSRPTGTFRGCLRNDAGLVPAGDNGWQHGAGIELFRRAHGMGLPRERRAVDPAAPRSEEHTSELQSLMRISYAVFCLKKKKKQTTYN